MRSGLSRENLVVPGKVVAHIHLNPGVKLGSIKGVQPLCLGGCLEVANESVVVPFIS